jgi:hypothetical protein
MLQRLQQRHDAIGGVTGTRKTGGRAGWIRISTSEVVDESVGATPECLAQLRPHVSNFALEEPHEADRLLCTTIDLILHFLQAREVCGTRGLEPSQGRFRFSEARGKLYESVLNGVGPFEVLQQLSQRFRNPRSCRSATFSLGRPWRRHVEYVWHLE